LEVQSENGQLTFRVPAFLDDLEPDAVHVQLYAEPRETTEPEIHPMTRGQLLPGVVNGYLYSVRIPALRPASDYTPRIVPAFDGVAVPLEARQILWYV
jgi:starch phosphorylase